MVSSLTSKYVFHWEKGEHNLKFRSFPIVASLLCLTLSSCGYIHFVFHTSCVLEVDLRQATFLTSYFLCLVPRVWGQSKFSFHSPNWSSRIRLSAEHLDLSPVNHYDGWSRPHTVVLGSPNGPQHCWVKNFWCQSNFHRVLCFWTFFSPQLCQLIQEQEHVEIRF